jgi:hypothetical protein
VARSAAGGLLPVRDGISLTASATPLAMAGGAPVLVVTVHAEQAAAQGVQAEVSERVDVATTVFTPSGQAIGGLAQKLDVTPKVDAGVAAFDLLQRLPTSPGRYEVRIGVTNPARHQTGSVYTFVDVPDFTNMAYAMSDVSVFAPASRPAISANLADVLLAPPTARREFDKGEHATAFLRFYQMLGAPTPVTVSMRIVDAQDRRRFSQDATIDSAAFKSNRSADYVIDLPIADLEPGAYLLTIQAKSGFLWASRRDVRFTVR